jgi:hypothetical protein
MGRLGGRGSLYPNVVIPRLVRGTYAETAGSAWVARMNRAMTDLVKFKLFSVLPLAPAPTDDVMIVVQSMLNRR